MRTIAIASLLSALVSLAAGTAHAQPAIPPTASSWATAPAAEDPETAIPTKSLLAVIRDGGLLMIPIGACSVILLMFVFERSISLRRGRVIPRPLCGGSWSNCGRVS